MSDSIGRDDPDRAGQTALEEAAHGGDAGSLNRLTDLVRAAGLDGTLIQALITGLGWDVSHYRGFDHLSETTRRRMLGKDAWYWHWKWADSALPEPCKAKLAADLVLISSKTNEVQKIERRKILSESITLIARGRLLIRANRVTDGMARFEEAAKVDASSGPVLRHAGDYAYWTGKGLTANEWFHMALHADNVEAFDFTVRPAGKVLSQQPNKCLFDYYGIDCVKSEEGDFVAQLPAIDNAAIHIIHTKVVRHVPPRARALLRTMFPTAWSVCRSLAVQVVALLVTRPRETPEYHGRDLLDVCRRIKAAEQTA